MNAGGAIVLIVVVIGLAVLLRARHKASTPAGWQILYSVGMPSAPTPTATGFTFAFPQAPGHVDYVQNRTPPVLAYGKTLTMRFRISGSGFTAQEFPAQQATVTLMLQRKGDDGSAQGPMANFRQYSGDMIPLAPGEFALVVPLTEQAFGGVYGAHDKTAFLDVLANLQSIGPVFGSAGGRGHGVYADKGSTFELLETGVQ